jgi:hypothetical protein
MRNNERDDRTAKNRKNRKAMLQPWFPSGKGMLKP